MDRWSVNDESDRHRQRGVTSRRAVASMDGRSVRVPFAAPERDRDHEVETTTTAEFDDEGGGVGEGLLRGGRDGSASAVNAAYSGGDHGDDDTLRRYDRDGGEGGRGWGLASSGESLRSSGRRRVELRTPAEEEAVRKASVCRFIVTTVVVVFISASSLFFTMPNFFRGVTGPHAVENRFFLSNSVPFFSFSFFVFGKKKTRKTQNIKTQK